MNNLIKYITQYGAGFYRFAKPYCILGAKQLHALYKRLPGWMGSGSLHLFLLVMLIGIPSCERNNFKRPSIIQIDLVAAPIAQKTSTPKIKKTQAKKPTKSAVSPVKKIRSKPTPPKPTPSPASKKPTPEKPKPAPKKPTKKPQEQKPKPPKESAAPKDALDNLLEDFLKDGKKPPQKGDTISQQTLSAVRAIQQQIEEQWVIPATVRFIDNPVVTLRFKLNQAGKLADAVTIVNRKRYAKDAAFRALADGAVRAVHNAAPFKGLNAKAHKHWGDLELTFNPQNML